MAKLFAVRPTQPLAITSQDWFLGTKLCILRGYRGEVTGAWNSALPPNPYECVTDLHINVQVGSGIFGAIVAPKGRGLHLVILDPLCELAYPTRLPGHGFFLTGVPIFKLFVVFGA